MYCEGVPVNTCSDVSSKIVIIDEDAQELYYLREMLTLQGWGPRLLSYPCCRLAWNVLQTTSADLIILNGSSLHHLTGSEFIGLLRSHPTHQHTPILLVTTPEDQVFNQQALDMGASELLIKPVVPLDLFARIRTLLRLKRLQDSQAQSGVAHQVSIDYLRQLQRSRLQIIWRLAKAAEFRDEETGEHVVRVACYSRVLSEHLGLPTSFLDLIFLAAPLHDIGKIGIPDAILMKTGRLTDQERQVIQTHCEIGERILREPSLTQLCLATAVTTSKQSSTNNCCEDSVEDDDLIILARQIALSHHERWDGRGYPQRLRGTEIPLAARIVNVADVYDALTSVRPYKPAFPVEEALRVMSLGRGTQFDPQVVDALLASKPTLIDIRQRVSSILNDVRQQTTACHHHTPANLPHTSAWSCDTEELSADYLWQQADWERFMMGAPQDRWEDAFGLMLASSASAEAR